MTAPVCSRCGANVPGGVLDGSEYEHAELGDCIAHLAAQLSALNDRVNGYWFFKPPVSASAAPPVSEQAEAAEERCALKDCGQPKDALVHSPCSGDGDHCADMCESEYGQRCHAFVPPAASNAKKWHRVGPDYPWHEVTKARGCCDTKDRLNTEKWHTGPTPPPAVSPAGTLRRANEVFGVPRKEESHVDQGRRRDPVVAEQAASADGPIPSAPEPEKAVSPTVQHDPFCPKLSGGECMCQSTPLPPPPERESAQGERRSEDDDDPNDGRALRVSALSQTAGLGMGDQRPPRILRLHKNYQNRFIECDARSCNIGEHITVVEQRPGERLVDANAIYARAEKIAYTTAGSVLKQALEWHDAEEPQPAQRSEKP